MLLMAVAALMWSSAGVVARHVQAADAFEMTFWRSLFNGVALLLLLSALRGGPASVVRSIRTGGRVLWASGVCWGVMYTAFMVALTLTSVANVLVTMAIAPLLTALVARVALGHRLAGRTWATIVVAGFGIVWMYAREVGGGDVRHLLGTAVALAVPIAGAVNWVLIQHSRGGASRQDLLPAVLIGALLSTLVALPLALPFDATTPDLWLLGLLGVFQLAIPCLLAVVAARSLSAPEASLLALLEVVFGVAWAWLGAGEAPSRHVLGGGLLVLAALATNEAIALRQHKAA
jgi:drug/metabolite transporter (DMT)-like permease